MAALYLRCVCLAYTAFHGLRCHPLTCMSLKLRLGLLSNPIAPTNHFSRTTRPVKFAVRTILVSPRALVLVEVLLVLVPAPCCLRVKIGFNGSLACLSCPLLRGGMPEHVLHIQSCTTCHEEPDYFFMASAGRLVQWSRVRMSADRVVAVGIFARVQQRADDFSMSKLRGQSKRQMAVAGA